MPKKTAPHASKPALDALRLREKVREAFGGAPLELRRDAAPPLLFEGRKLAEATSYAPGTSLWYEVAAYAGIDGYAASIALYTKGRAEQDQFSAETFATLEDMLRHLETYDPRRDVPVPEGLSAGSLPPAMAAVGAAALRQRMAEAASEYRSAACEVLTELAALESARAGASI